MVTLIPGISSTTVPEVDVGGLIPVCAQLLTETECEIVLTVTALAGTARQSLFLFLLGGFFCTHT